MTYLQAHKRPYQSFRKTTIAVIVVIVAVVIIMQLFASHLFPSLVTAVARPFWRTEFSIESGALKSVDALLNENETLSRQLADAQVRLDTIRAIELENSELKMLLGRDEPVQTRILAAVLKRPPLSKYDELIIDVGRDYNLSTSSMVYASGNILIGQVIDVLSTTAKVKLFSSPGDKFEVLIGPMHTPATAIGRGGGQYETQVSRGANVKEGDFVINTSLNDKPFGIVNAVLQDPTQAFETILFASPVNLYQLRWVLVDRK